MVLNRAGQLSIPARRNIAERRTTVPMRPSTGLLGVIAGFAASTSLAHATNYTSVEAIAGEPVRRPPYEQRLRAL